MKEDNSCIILSFNRLICIKNINLKFECVNCFVNFLNVDNLVIVFNLISQGPLSFDDTMYQKG